MSVSVSHTTKNKPPRLPYEEITSKVAGTGYEASVVFVGEKRAQALNIAYRKKDYIPNVLSFPLSDTSGEIYICPNVAKKEAKNFNLTYKGYVTFLLIHGLLHLKGYDHGATMEKLERKYMRAFSAT